MRSGLDAGYPPVNVLIGRHRAWVTALWGRPCSVEAYSGLADLYHLHPDFTARYERIEPGFTQYLTTAMRLHVQQQRAAPAGQRG